MEVQQLVSIITTYAPLAVGVIMPPLVSIILKDIPKNKDRTRVFATLFICMFVAALENLSKLRAGNVDAFFMSAGIIFTEAHVVYKAYFNNSYINSLIYPTPAVTTITPTAQELDPNTAP